jgi:phage repressor protein C with HTH and peptisase S24 domain
MLTISQRVKNLRERLGLTQLAFADRMLFDRSYIGQVEGGKREPGPRFIRQLEILEREAESGLDRADKSSPRGRPLNEAMLTQRPDSVRQVLGISGPRDALRRAREEKGLSVEQLAKLIRHPASYIHNVEKGRAPATERFLRAVVKELPELDIEELMSGSDVPRVLDRSGMSGTYGDAPQIAVPSGHSVRNVPVLSYAQAGAETEWTDELYAHEVFPVIDLPTTAKAFAMPLKGDSMEPRYRAGDMVIVLRDAEPHTGDEVVACRRNGDVMFKVYNRSGDRITLTSYNAPLHPPITLAPRELRWVWPIHGVYHRSRPSRYFL